MDLKRRYRNCLNESMTSTVSSTWTSTRKRKLEPDDIIWSSSNTKKLAFYVKISSLNGIKTRKCLRQHKLVIYIYYHRGHPFMTSQKNHVFHPHPLVDVYTRST